MSIPKVAIFGNNMKYPVLPDCMIQNDSDVF